MMYLSRIGKPVGQLSQNFTALLYNVSTMSTASTNISEPSLSPELKTFNDIPGPSGLYAIPYFGPALLFKPFTKYEPSEMNELLSELKNKYGDIFKLRFGMNYMIYVNHPDYAKTVLQAQYEEHRRLKFDLNIIFAERNKLTKGMILLDGKEWADRRKPAQEKMLKPSNVATYVPLIEKVTNDFVDKLRSKGEVDDLVEELSCYTTESVGMLCFNKRLDCLNGRTDNIAANAVREFLGLLQKSFFSPFKPYLYYRSKMYRQFEKVGMAFYRYTNEEIKSQRAFLEKLKKEGKLEEYLEKEPNFMYSLLADGRLSDDAINSTITDLFGAGIDSTANTMCFLLMELAINKDKQSKLYDEIKRVVGDSKQLTKEHLARMSYLKACLRESHRKTFPISFGVVRILESDLAVGGYLLPKNSLLAINNGSMVTDERFFPRPKEFIPERWLRETSGDIAMGKQYPFASKPFGFGPRSCIGQRFAENEIFIGVTKIIQNFEVSMPPETTDFKTTLKIFTTPKEKVKLFLKER